MFENLKSIYFIGIGGISMSALAKIFLNRGVKVFGSDLHDSPLINELREKGVNIRIGEEVPEFVQLCDAIIYTSAVSDENKDRLFSGDTIFYHSYGRTDFPTGSGGTIIRSILDKLLVLDGGMEVFPGHGDTTTIDEEKKCYRRDISGNIN